MLLQPLLENLSVLGVVSAVGTLTGGLVCHCLTLLLSPPFLRV